MNVPAKRGIVVCGILLAVSACSRGSASPSDTSGAPADKAAASAAARGSSGGGNWTDHGATACDMYLTPALVAAILSRPSGHSKKLSPQSCTYQTDSGDSISITLASAGPDAFDRYQQFLVDPVPLPGVGDKASRSMIGIDAVKGADRMCTIDTGGAPGATRLRGEALAQQLGKICNQLFALP